MQYIQILRSELENILRNRVFWLLLASLIIINTICLYHYLQSNNVSSSDLSLEDYQIEYSEFLSDITVKSDENKTIQLFHNNPYTLRNIDKTRLSIFTKYTDYLVWRKSVNSCSTLFSDRYSYVFIS